MKNGIHLAQLAIAIAAGVAIALLIIGSWPPVSVIVPIAATLAVAFWTNRRDRRA